jgi:uncharacterized damage-inducible protein DinB
MVPLELWDWRPEPFLSSPTSLMRNTSQLANHIACAPLCLYESFQGNIPDEKTYQNFEKNNMPLNAEGLTNLYEDGINKLIRFLQDHLEDAHEENIRFFYHNQDTSIYKEVFDEIGHEWFHLGQLFTYLRQNGIPVDMGAYYGYKDPDPGIPPN